MVSNQDVLGGNGDKDVANDGEMGARSLFLGVLEHVDILGDAWGIGVAALHLGGKVDGVNGVEAAAVVR